MLSSSSFRRRSVTSGFGMPVSHQQILQESVSRFQDRFEDRFDRTLEPIPHDDPYHKVYMTGPLRLTFEVTAARQTKVTVEIPGKEGCQPSLPFDLSRDATDDEPELAVLELIDQQL